MRLILAAALLLAMPAAAQSTLSPAVRQMVEAAASSGDKAKIDAVVAVAKETNKGSEAEIDKIVADISAAKAAEREQQFGIVRMVAQPGLGGRAALVLVFAAAGAVGYRHDGDAGSLALGQGRLRQGVHLHPARNLQHWKCRSALDAGRAGVAPRGQSCQRSGESTAGLPP